MNDANLIAEIRPALREFDVAQREGRTSLCLTLEVEGNRRVWVQLVEAQVNIGLYDKENASSIQEGLKKHRLRFAETSYRQGQYVDICLPGQRDERFELFLHDVLIRHQRGRPCSLNVKYEDL